MAVSDKEKMKSLSIKSTNVILISDTHFGVSSSSEEWQQNIGNYFKYWFIPYIQKELMKTPDVVLCCLGDVYHDRKSIDIEVNELVIDIFEELASLLPVYILNGNHDLSKKTNKGKTSLRSLNNIPNLTIIKEPTMLKFVEGRKGICNVAAIPYLGEKNEENAWLVKCSGKSDYAFMHTDISKMKFDNGMTIVGAVDAEKFSGQVFSGHIHKRQETKKVIYVGSPYQLSRGDIGNTKGIYKLNLQTKEMEFTENVFSPKFQKTDLKTFMDMGELERQSYLSNAYTDIIIEDDIAKKYKMTDVYEIVNASEAKRVQFITKRSNKEINVDDSVEYQESSLQELINEAIDAIEGVDDEDKAEMKSMSCEYLRNAQSELDKV